MEKVSWNDAVEFCSKLSVREGRMYRLPTEAEWEYACRAGTTTAFSFGETLSGTDASFKRDSTYGGAGKGPNWGETAPVGSCRANPFGLYDMHGNVWEWCQDWYAEDYYEHSPLCDPRGPSSGLDRVSRGGCWCQGPGLCRSAMRRSLTPGYRTYSLGFRVALVPAE